MIVSFYFSKSGQGLFTQRDATFLSKEGAQPSFSAVIITALTAAAQC